MKTSLILLSAIISLAVAYRTSGAPPAADDASDQLIDVVVNLLSDKDKDFQAIGLQQVREEVKGTAATKRFVELLPKLTPDTRTGLIDALGARGDKTARGAVVEMLKAPEEQVRAAALRALGFLGEAGDVPLMAQSLTAGGETEKTAAKRSLEQIRAEGVDEKIVGELKAATDPRRQTALIEIVQRRKATATVPILLNLAVSDKADIRAAAMQALGQLAGAEDIPNLVKALLATESGPQRDAAEKSIMFVCARIKDANERAGPLLAVWEQLGDEKKTIVLPTLGRVGGPKALKVVEEAIAGDNAQRRDAGVRALCNWPDASVAGRLLEMAQTSNSPNYRSWTLRALTRVAVLHDSRSDAERLDLLKKAMTLTDSNEERNYVLERAKAIRTMDSVRFVLSYMDKPELSQHACATVVELAHYRELRDPNKAEFDMALDKVIGICKDPTLVDYAKRYRRGETVELRTTTSQ
ncbi:MAG: HEAT repeat domain-containing protein [Thermoguttaceae bacterium]